MTAENFLQASLLDIIFEKRNREYGAYTLRKNYNKRLFAAIVAVLTLVVIATLVMSLGTASVAEIVKPVTEPIELISIPEKQPEPIVTPPPLSARAPVASLQFTTPPKIIADDLVAADDIPPTVDDLQIATIDIFHNDGLADDGTLTAPNGLSTGVIGALRADRRPEDSILIDVQIESTYPGGAPAWGRFLNKTFVYPSIAVENGLEGTVVIQFVVDTDGTISNVQAVSGPEALKKEAVRVIQKSGRWKPAFNNGRQVKSYKRQPISFKLNIE